MKSLEKFGLAAFIFGAILLSESTAQARFLQPDPIGPKDDINLYNYTHDDPVNGTDPTGEVV